MTYNVEYRDLYSVFIKKEKNMENGNCKKYVIDSEYTKEDFLRRAWVQLAKEKIAEEVFDLDFSEVKEKERVILNESGNAKVSYSASVGYDRQEPYIDYESYREKVGDKYVTRQRQVTKYKTVTDWSPISGETSVECFSYVQNDDEYPDVNIRRFKNCMYSAKIGIQHEAAEDVAKRVEVSQRAKSESAEKLKESAGSAVRRHLPGDQDRDFSYGIKDLEVTNSELYIVKEYSATIKVGEKCYTKTAYPFGDSVVFGDDIPVKADIDKEIEKEKKSLYTTVWEKSCNTVFLSMILSVVSILVSLLIPVTSIMVIAVLVAAGAFAYSLVFSKITETATEKAIDEKCKEYSEKFAEKQTDLLNKKLKSLGFEPLCEADLVEYDEVYYI